MSSNAAAIDQLAQNAVRAAEAGAMGEAERLWREVRRLDPGHPGALFSLAVHAFQKGDLKEASELLAGARQASPGDPMLCATRATVLRELGDVEGARREIQAGLTLNPYHLPCHLEEALLKEKWGPKWSAAIAYKHALTIAGDNEAYWPAPLRDRLLRARAAVQEYSAAVYEHLARAVAPLGEALSNAEAQRWREAVSIMSGKTRPYESVSNQLHVPRLPAIPFFERSQFPWADELEAQTAAITHEMKEALATESGEFTPYITYNPGEPVNQWADLNHSRRWSTYSLWKGGQAVEAHQARCPKTVAALARTDMASIEGLCPNAMFSALAPRTVIPPHNGETNARLVAHLPLIVPEGCLFKVGFEERQWRVGELMVFDDTLEHTARNDSDELRVILLFDVWNPLLSPSERALVGAMTSAMRAFHGTG